jgi:aspartate/methionine/tyrosine aminotransferase
LGKVFTTKEFERLSTLLEKFPRAIILEDQSYFLYYQDGHKPIPVGTLSAETFKKSLTIYSGGKTFNVTGARVGFVLGPREIIKQIAEIQFKEMALASAFEQLVMRDNLVSAHETNFYENIRTKINKIGETVKRVLSKMGFKMLTFEGTYYMVINVEHLRGKIEEKYYYQLDNPAIKTNELDKAFCRKLYLTSKVGLIPLSSLHFKEGALDNLVRVAINRSEEDIKLFLDSMCIFVDS